MPRQIIETNERMPVNLSLIQKQYLKLPIIDQIVSSLRRNL